MPLHDPPRPGMPSTVKNALAAMDYDSNNLAFTDGTNTYYLFPERDTGTSAKWFYDTGANAGVCPKCKVHYFTFKVIKYGTLQQDGTILYEGTYYRIALEWDSSLGALIANATT